MIRLQTTERFLKHSHGYRFVAAVRTYFRHKKDAIAFSLKSRSQPLFRLSPVILPAIVEKCDAAVQRFLHDLRGDLLVVGIPEVMAATGYGRNGNAGAPEVAHRHLTAAVWHYLGDPMGRDTFRGSPLRENAAEVPEEEALTECGIPEPPSVSASFSEPASRRSICRPIRTKSSLVLPGRSRPSPANPADRPPNSWPRRRQRRTSHAGASWYRCRSDTAASTSCRPSLPAPAAAVLCGPARMWLF